MSSAAVGTVPSKKALGKRASRNPAASDIEDMVGMDTAADMKKRARGLKAGAPKNAKKRGRQAEDSEEEESDVEDKDDEAEAEAEAEAEGGDGDGDGDEEGEGEGEGDDDGPRAPKGKKGVKDTKDTIVVAPKKRNKYSEEQGQRTHTQLLRLLPRNKALRWCLLVEAPASMLAMVQFVKAFNKQLTIYLTDDRREVPGQGVTGFRGLAIDAVDSALVCMTIARLSCTVVNSPMKGFSGTAEEIAALPPVTSVDEKSVTVSTSDLLTLLKDIRANQTMVIYQEEDAVGITIGVADVSGEGREMCMSTLDPVGEHNTLRNVTYTYQVSVPLETLRRFCRTVSTLGGSEVRLEYRKISSTERALCLQSQCPSVPNLFEVIPMTIVPDLPGAGSAELSETTTAAERVASLKGVHRAESTLYDGGDPGFGGEGPSHPPARSASMKRYDRLHGASYSVKYLLEILAPLVGNAQVSMFLRGVENPDAPLLLRVPLGKCDSFVAWALAPKLERDGEDNAVSPGGSDDDDADDDAARIGPDVLGDDDLAGSPGGGSGIGGSSDVPGDD
jgi:hypothetical protein